ncbi:uncharacterized protein BCR38DRAFT_440750 [Pseudomassariella vexata]|uniref:Uncharacterized protein n=1 Tax=Pseudomassariella vexata TaxID=1141098 RepID=A0A1Y2DQQ5_9PEZI|nr:uncharacterized protein BCR38DRAFT_440750 [Pseudomassariella vexata]ORY61632.1 hypothetical protein BCR38DRAFT_440750 [Pseudomassariella vexata]
MFVSRFQPIFQIIQALFEFPVTLQITTSNMKFISILVAAVAPLLVLGNPMAAANAGVLSASVPRAETEACSASCEWCVGGICLTKKDVMMPRAETQACAESCEWCVGGLCLTKKDVLTLRAETQACAESCEWCVGGLCLTKKL